jgi:hypothetical protein
VLKNDRPYYIIEEMGKFLEKRVTAWNSYRKEG